MSDPEPTGGAEAPSPRPRRWPRRLAWTFGVLLVVAYGLAQGVYHLYFMAFYHYPQRDAVEIAVGLRAPERGYELPESNDPEFSRPACKAYGGEEVSHKHCIVMLWEYRPTACAWWRFEPCAPLTARHYLLDRAELLGGTLSALQDPCRYLRVLDDPAQRRQMSDKAAKRLGGDYERFRCGTGNPISPPRTIVRFFDPEEREIAVIVVKPPR